jgi:hypothetical protein
MSMTPQERRAIIANIVTDLEERAVFGDDVVLEAIVQYFNSREDLVMESTLNAIEEGRVVDAWGLQRLTGIYTILADTSMGALREMIELFREKQKPSLRIVKNTVGRKRR